MGKNRAVIVTLFFLFLFLGAAFAQGPIKAEVDKTSLAMGETLNYKITINYTGKEHARPKIPKFEGFRVVSSAQSSNVSFVKNNIQRNTVYIYILAPTAAGNFKIEPTTIKIGKDAYASDTFKIEVQPAPPDKPLPLPESDQPQITL